MKTIWKYVSGMCKIESNMDYVKVRNTKKQPKTNKE